MQRLTKYKQRGYELASSQSDERVSDAWKNHILLQVQILYTRHWLEEWMNAHGIFGATGILDILERNVKPEARLRNSSALHQSATAPWPDRV